MPRGGEGHPRGDGAEGATGAAEFLPHEPLRTDIEPLQQGLGHRGRAASHGSLRYPAVPWGGERKLTEH